MNNERALTIPKEASIRLTLPDDISHDGPEAAEVCRYLASLMDALEDGMAKARYALGRQFCVIQQEKLYQQMERRDYISPNAPPEGIPAWSRPEKRFYLSWEDFWKNGIPMMIGLRKSSVYHYMKVARAKVIKDHQQEIGEVRHVTNLIHVAQLEGNGYDCTEEVWEDVKSLTPIEFKTKYEQCGSGAATRDVVTMATMTDIIREFLKQASPSGMEMFHTMIEQGLARLGDNADDLITLWYSGQQEFFQQEEAKMKDDYAPEDATETFVRDLKMRMQKNGEYEVEEEGT